MSTARQITVQAELLKENLWTLIDRLYPRHDYINRPRAVVEAMDAMNLLLDHLDGLVPLEKELDTD